MDPLVPKVHTRISAKEPSSTLGTSGVNSTPRVELAGGRKIPKGKELIASLMLFEGSARARWIKRKRSPPVERRRSRPVLNFNIRDPFGCEECWPAPALTVGYHLSRGEDIEHEVGISVGSDGCNADGQREAKRLRETPQAPAMEEPSAKHAKPGSRGVDHDRSKRALAAGQVGTP